MTQSNTEIEPGPATIAEDELARIQALLGTAPAAALDAVERLLDQGSKDFRAFEIAALALRALARPAEAEKAELSAIQASFANPELEAAATADHDGLTQDAQSILDRFLTKYPTNLLALTIAAEIDLNLWDLNRAEMRFQAVLQRAPSYLRAIMLLSQVLTSQSRIKAAISVLENVVRRKRSNVPALQALGQAYSEANRHAPAAAAFERIVSLDSKRLQFWILQAQELRMLGRGEESKAVFRRALQVHPASGPAWWGLVNFFPSDIRGQDEVQLEKAVAEAGDDPADGGPLHIALAIVAERKGDFAKAFHHYSRGNAIRQQTQPHDPDLLSGNVDEIIEHVSPEIFSRAAARDGESDAPIFIIGMLRSGTTLLERILGRHSKIEACGELLIMPRLGSELCAGTSATYAPRVAAMRDDDLKAIGDTYLERSLNYRTSSKPHFVDKLNFNWFRAGLIKLALPNARIIDVRRDPIDCCWANFKMMFADTHTAANDQRDVARFYRDYVRMVDTIDDAAPGGMLRVQYEELVDDVEGETRRVLAFLGLEYEAECVEFHRSTEAVATPSSEQVRRPINRQGIGSANPYREWLGPMIDELGEFAR